MAHNATISPPAPVGLVLSGGGARAAYQVGVLKAIAEVLPDRCGNPFPIVCGTSAGGLNAAGLAIQASCLSDGVRLLQQCLRELLPGRARHRCLEALPPHGCAHQHHGGAPDGQRCHPHLLSAGTDQPRILRRWRSASDRAAKLCPASGRRESAGDRRWQPRR